MPSTANHYQRVSIRNNFRNEWVVHQTTPAPPSSDLVCTIGTNAGIIQLGRDESIDWVAPKDAAWPGPIPTEIFDQDFMVGNHNILFAAGRQGHVFMIDLRVPSTESEWMSHGRPVTHLRSVNPHQLLVAGLRSSMDIYDLRFRKTLPNGTKPLLSFPDYRNEAHIHIGWDVDVDNGVVAAAHDNATVALYSLRSGTRLRAPAIDAIRSSTPVKAMMFQTMPRRHTPSLFVGLGPSIQKFSFGEEDVSD
jgi:hypothetical protein